MEPAKSKFSGQIGKVKFSILQQVALLFALGVLVILISLITSISFHAIHGTLYTYVLMFGMVAAGAGLLIKVLFKPNSKGD